ncbi:MAG: universal stress protein [Pseudomonadaceae bacterium]|nr:universal stress protein [Pseudomonadaceae bacterium]
MREWNNIVVVIPQDVDVRSVLNKVSKLADIESNTVVNAIRVAYDASVEHFADDSESAGTLKRYLLDSEKLALERTIEATRLDFEHLECHSIWDESVSHGVLLAAEKLDADVIVKPMSAEPDRWPVRTPDDWNTLRGASVPVLLCGELSWSAKPGVLAAVDVSDEAHESLNVRILRQADGLARALNGSLSVISAYPSVALWSANPSIFNSYQSSLERAKSNAADAMASLLASVSMESMASQINEGKPEQVIQRAVEQQDAELLIIGNSGRTGVPGLLLGNTAEQLIFKTSIDLLCVP